MARNEERRRSLADAGIEVLAEVGARGLSHRAVDRRAAVPAGTASNYFRSRKALVAAIVDRIEERLTPDPDVHAELARRTPDASLFEAYMLDICDRLLGSPDVSLALFEMRLEGVRQPEVAEVLSAWRRGTYDAAVEFNRTATLPGGPREIALFHYAIDGVVFDALTGPLDPAHDVRAVVHTLVERLMPD